MIQTAAEEELRWNPTKGLLARPAEGNHVVQFYEDDDFLCDVISDFLAGALAASEPAVAITAEARRRALSARLQVRGFDIVDAREGGQLVFIDPRELLSRFMVGGMPDAELFKDTINAIIDAALARGFHPLIRIYGDAVDVLARENVQAAIRLEELWNEFGASHPVTMLCAYAMQTFSKNEQTRPFLHICRNHSHVIPTEKFSRLQDSDARLREVTMLQQCARALESEIEQRKQRKQAEEALLDARAQLEHVGRVTHLGELTASIAHQINQPLAAIVTNAGASLRWLAKRPPDIDRAREGVERTMEEGVRAGKIVERIRALVKKSPPREDRIDLNKTISEVIELTRSQVERHDISLQTRLSNDLPLIRGDRIQLQQVILNLINNAVEAMSGLRPAELVVSSGKDGSGSVLVSVEDSGRGLGEGDLDRLFEPFYTTKPDGMGMGLAISRVIIAAHGGRLWATANTPRGAVFQFTLPRGGDSPTGEP